MRTITFVAIALAVCSRRGYQPRGAGVEFYWHFHAKSVKDGAPVESDGRETQIYNRLDDGWQLVHVHYSGPAQEFR